jgi:hypothetical protein
MGESVKETHACHFLTKVRSGRNVYKIEIISLQPASFYFLGGVC